MSAKGVTALTATSLLTWLTVGTLGRLRSVDLLLLCADWPEFEHYGGVLGCPGRRDPDGAERSAQ